MISFKITDGTGIKIRAARRGILTEKLMYDLGQSARATIVKLTNENRDYRGKNFPAYSKKPIYVSKRHKPKPKGGRTKHKTTGRPLRSHAYDRGYLQFRVAMGRSPRPDLQFSGRMLANLQIVKLSRSIVVLGFPSKAEQDKALGNITGRRGNIKRVINPRPFMGIGAQHERGIRAVLEEHLEEVATATERKVVTKIA